MKSGKGSQFERDISKLLSKWWTGGERDDVFWRSQQSGGRATQRAKKGKGTANQQGDIQAMDPIGQPLIDRVCVELKCGYPKFGIDCLINSSQRKSFFMDFVAQCEREEADSKRGFLLIIKQNFKDPICVFDHPVQRILGDHNIWLRDVFFLSITAPGGDWPYVALKLDDFLRLVPPGVFGA